MFSDNLKILRWATKIGQKELADKLNISVKTVSHWETGYCEPSISQPITLSDFFGISIDELAGKEKI